MELAMPSCLVRVVAGLAVIIAVLPALAGAQEEGYAFKLSNFRIEMMGSWGRISPTNLNRGADNENAYIDHYYTKKYAYYESIYGEAYRVSYISRKGTIIQPLESITPVGASIRYQLSPTFALSLGIQYMKGVRTSSIGMDVAVEDDRAAAPYNEHYSNDGFQLSVEAWMPQLGAHFGWNLGKLLRTEIFLLGGPILGDTRVWNQRRESVSTAEGTTSSSQRTMEITGHSNSLAMEMGGQLRLQLLPFLDLFAQPSYAFRKLTRIHGLNTIRTVTELPSASESLYAYSGTWGIGWEQVSTPWGPYRAPRLTTEFNPTWAWGTTGIGSTVANVDLSGFQIAAGLSIRL
jgi:hypothetical protein